MKRYNYFIYRTVFVMKTHSKRKTVRRNFVNALTELKSSLERL